MQIDLSPPIITEICQNQPQITNLFPQPDSFVLGFTGNHKARDPEITPFFVPYFHRVQRISPCRYRFSPGFCRKIPQKSAAR